MLVLGSGLCLVVLAPKDADYCLVKRKHGETQALAINGMLRGLVGVGCNGMAVALRVIFSVFFLTGYFDLVARQWLIP